MTRLSLALSLVVALLVGCEQPRPTPQADRTVSRPNYRTLAADPYINVPLCLREHNYSGGSCMHASTESGLNWVGQNDPRLLQLSPEWRRRYSGGEDVDALAAKLDRHGVKYAMVSGRNFKELTIAANLRLLPMIGWPSGHCVNCLGVDDAFVYIQNNNSEQEITQRTHSQFMSEWQGWAIVLIGTPPPPVPRI